MYKNRLDAGKKLAMNLQQYQNLSPIILALPRGGVVIGYEVAALLHAPLDVIVARKLGAPGQPEYAIGAIAPGGVVVLNQEAESYKQFSDDIFQELISRETMEMQRRILLYRGTDADLTIKDKIVIVVDDGVATGLTAVAALRALRKLKPAQVIFAVPVGAVDAIQLLRAEADVVICLEIPRPFYAVGEWYENFPQVEDAEVIKMLTESRQFREVS